MATETEVASLQKELAYYKKQVDKLSGEIIKNQYLLAQLSNESKQYFRGFQTIAEVNRSFNLLATPDAFQEQVLDTVITYMAVDKVILLKYDQLNEKLYTSCSRGSNGRGIPLEKVEFPLSDSFAADRKTLCVNSTTFPSVLESLIQEKLEVPFFIITPLYKNDTFWGALYAGRKQERKPMHLPFTQSDIYVFESLAGALSSLTHQLEQRELLEKERNRIARDMHDEIGSGLTHIALMSELMQTQKKTDEEMRREIKNIASSARSLVESMSEIIWALNPYNDTLENLLSYLREQTLNSFEPFDLDFSIRFPDEVPPVKLSNEQRRNLYLVAKEALNNALKYSEAKSIRLGMDYQNNTICFFISDNGKGFDTNRTGVASNGLRNMQRRMEEIGGTFNLQTGKSGTAIRFLLPVSEAALMGPTTFFTSASER